MVTSPLGASGTDWSQSNLPLEPKQAVTTLDTLHYKSFGDTIRLQATIYLQSAIHIESASQPKQRRSA